MLFSLNFILAIVLSKSRTPRRYFFKEGLEIVYMFSHILFLTLHHLLHNTTVSPTTDTYTLWHARFDHANDTVIHRIIKHCKLPFSAKIGICDSCILGKAHQLPFSDSHTVYTASLQLIYIDIWGPSPTASSNGSYYYIAFLDAYTKYTWFYLLQRKSQAAPIFKSFKTFAEKQTGYQLKVIQTDNAKEFLCIKPYLVEHGIHHRLTCPYTHEQNGSIERKHCHTTEVGLTILAHASLPIKYWGEAFTTVVTIINVLPSPVLKFDNPYHFLFNKQPHYSFFKIFGCACYPLMRPFSKNKLNFRSDICLFLGCSPQYKGYVCVSNEGKTYITQHVVFNESLFQYSQFFTLPDTNPTPLHSSSSLPSLTVLDFASPTSPSSSPSLDIISSHSSTSPSHISSPSPIDTPPEHPPITQNIHPMITKGKSGISKPLVFSSTVDIEVVPSTVKEALKLPNWVAAMKEEYDALLANHTWTLTHPPQGIQTIGCKWVFKSKYNVDGSFQRHKARLVAKGFHQHAGIDYSEMFSPVVKPKTIRIILTIALSKQWPIHQIDINNAFLYGDLQESVYMLQPPGFNNDPTLVCKLHKAIYGLKQAPRSWFHKLSQTLFSFGFSATKSDTSLFIKTTKNVTLFVLIYVDDILITGSSLVAIQSLIFSLQQHFGLKDLGHLHYFLDIVISWTTHGSLHLSQTKYITDLHHKSGMLSSKPQPTPMISSMRLTRDGTIAVDDPSLYRSIVGSLQYILITRPELSYSVNKVCQYLHNPQLHHWKAVKRILQYLAGTRSHGLLLQPSPHLTIVAFADVDWGSDLDDRKFISGYTVFFGSNHVVWSSNKQKTVSRSTTEAEYRSIATALAEIKWVSNLLQELSIYFPTPKIYSDNLGVVLLAANPIMHSVPTRPRVLTKVKHVM